jgi:hypothetical protein
LSRDCLISENNYAGLSLWQVCRFPHAALVLDEGFYNIKTPNERLDRIINEIWLQTGLKQPDPIEEYRLNGKIDEETRISKHVLVSSAEPVFIHSNSAKLDIWCLWGKGRYIWTDAEGKWCRLLGP